MDIPTLDKLCCTIPENNYDKLDSIASEIGYLWSNARVDGRDISFVMEDFSELMQQFVAELKKIKG